MFCLHMGATAKFLPHLGEQDDECKHKIRQYTRTGDNASVQDGPVPQKVRIFSIKLTFWIALRVWKPTESAQRYCA